MPDFQNVTLKCLTEIASITGETTREYNKEYVELFKNTVEQLKKIIPIEFDLKKAYANGHDKQQVIFYRLKKKHLLSGKWTTFSGSISGQL